MIRLQNVSKYFGTKMLFSHIDFHFPEGEKIALIGDNGTGKTTLLNIISSKESLDDGKVIYPSDLSLGSIAQEFSSTTKLSTLEEAISGAKKIRLLKEKLESSLKKLEEDSSEKIIQEYDEIETAYRIAGGYTLKQRSEAILMGLGFNKEQFHLPCNRLSGGWRMRLEMAKMLLNEPNFIILDEPTNHLDLPSLIWFEKYMQQFKGTLLFVTHDIELINRLATTILHLENGQFKSYRGNYINFLKQKEENLRLEQTTRDNLLNKKEHLEKFITRFRAKSSKAKQAQSKQKMVDKINEQIKELPLSKIEHKIHIKFPPPLPCERVAYEVITGAIGYQHTLFENINLLIEKNFKIAVIGPNGIGKSTLLKTIASILPPTGGSFVPARNLKIAYFSQNITDQLDENMNLIDTILQNSSATHQEARSILGALLFRNDDVLKKVKVLSGGEKNRVHLARTLAKKANILLLDEPTNHLDIASVQSLSQALKQYQGCIVFVSHNRSFINSICSHVLACSTAKSMQLFPSNLHDYPKLAKLANFPNVLEENLSHLKENKSENKTSSYMEQKNLKKEKNKLIKDIEKFEKKLEETKIKIQRIQDNITKAIQEKKFDEVKKLTSNQSIAKKEEKTHEEQWFESLEKLELFNKNHKS